MFVRTERLTLRPAWPEDAAELATAVGHESVVRDLARVPWPYPLEAAETFTARPRDATQAAFLIFLHEDTRLRLIGSVDIMTLPERPHELGYWITPDAWGRGYATEAAAATLRAARAAGVRHVTAGHFTDNPASGCVLRKLGFRPTGRTEAQFSQGRNAVVPCARYALELAGKDCNGIDPDARMAA